MNSLNFFHSFTVEALISGNATLFLSLHLWLLVWLSATEAGKQNAEFSCRRHITSLEIYFIAWKYMSAFFFQAFVVHPHCCIFIDVLVWHWTGQTAGIKRSRSTFTATHKPWTLLPLLWKMRQISLFIQIKHFEYKLLSYVTLRNTSNYR